MKILNLKITNLASIANATIDFQHGALSNCNTFLIAGPTGSGKTTILDAISLALYNKSSRLQGNLRRNLSHEAIERIRKGCTQAEVILTIIGNDNNTYQITWTDKIIRKKGEPAGQITQQIINLQTGEIIGDGKPFKEAIETRIIGLDSEQFFRTTMLAQQEFTKFLKSDDEEKSNILAKLSDTEKYDGIGKYINLKNIESRRQKENIETSINTIQTLDNEQINQLNEEKTTALTIQKQEKEHIDQLQKIIITLTQLEQNESTAQQLTAKLANLTADYQKCLSLLHQAEEQKSEIKNKQKELQTKTNIPAQLIELYEHFSQTRAQLQSRQDYIKNIEKLTQENRQLSTLIPQLEASRKSAQDDAENAKKQYDKCIELSEKHQPLETYQKQQNSLIEKKNELTRYNSDLKRIADYQNEVNSIINTVNETKTKLTNIETDYKSAEGNYKQAVENQEKAQTHYNKTFAEAAKDLNKIRQTLQQGDICPVCGQKITQLLTNEVFAKWQDNAKKELESAKKKTESCHRLLQEVKAQKDQLSGILKTQEPRIEKGKEAIQNVKNNLTQYHIYQEIKDYDNRQLASYESTINTSIENLTKQISEVNEANKKLNDAIRQLSLKQGIWQQAHSKLESHKELIRQKEQIISDNQKEINSLNESVSQAIEFHVKQWETIEFESLISQLETEVRQYNNAKISLATLNEQIEHLEKQLISAHKSKEQCILLQPDYAGLQVVETQYATDFDNLFSNVANRLKDVLEQQSANQQQYKNLGCRANNFTTADKPAILQQITEHTTTLEQAGDTISRIVQKLEDNTKENQRLETFRQQLIQARHTHELWKRLNDLFGGPDGKYFQKIAQAHVMRYLLNKANNYLTQLTNRYTLTCEPNSLRILVIDHDNGAQKRDSANLSGGESFIVSLALALGLSDINANGLKVDTLFIDEGFGTLSDEPMQNAINTLLNLHKLQNGRKVGIISHIEALKENIHPQIMVTKAAGDNAPSTISIIE